MRNNSNNVVWKIMPIDPEQLAEHHSNLDDAYRYLQKAYKIMTYEQGRLEDEPGLELLGLPVANRLGTLADRLQQLGVDLKALVLEEGEEGDALKKEDEIQK
jgi:hypothetical protein